MQVDLYSSCKTVVIIIIIIFVYLIADKTYVQLTVITSAMQGGTQQPPCRTALYTEGFSTAKLMPHTAHSG